MIRENRYIVIKRKELLNALGRDERIELGRLCKKIEDYRDSLGKPPLICAVIESDWPEYEPTWQAIEKRVDGMEEEMSDRVWLPIESAPKDGTHILVFILWQIPPHVTVAHWFDGGWWPSVCRNEYETALPVSHWMPLPSTMHKDMFP